MNNLYKNILWYIHFMSNQVNQGISDGKYQIKNNNLNFDDYGNNKLDLKF